jgi:glycosyltransferase involved in cell wall biosynthesis
MVDESMRLDVSVVMPAHRVDAHLLQALASVEAAMAGVAAELIVVANGPDRQAVNDCVLRHRTSAFTRAEVVELSGLVYSLNRGIELARGEFVARFDADDICLPGRFVRQLAIARQSDADFVFSAADPIDDASQPTGSAWLSALPLWRRCRLIHPTAFARRAALVQLGGYGNLEFSEDYHLWLRAAQQGCRFEIDRLPAIRYRVHEAQSTRPTRLADTFATNVGVKLSLGLRHGNGWLLWGAAGDLANFVVRKCRSAFF